MVDMKTQTKPVNPRTAIREARQRRLRLVQNQGKPATIKVWPANEDMREVLRHANGTRFRDSLDQAVEWPNDSFTARRIADGSVRTDGPAPTSHHPELLLDESLNPRQHAAALMGARAVVEHVKNPPKATTPQPKSEPHTAA